MDLKLYPLAEAARSLGIATQTLRIQARSGRIRAYKIGSQYVVDEAAIEEYRSNVLGRPGGHSRKGTAA